MPLGTVVAMGPGKGPRIDKRKVQPMQSLLADLRYAARRLRRAPLFTASAVAILTIGIGLNTIVFNLVDTALFRPLPFEDASRIVHVYQDSDSGVPTSTSFPAYRDIAAMTDVFAHVAATSAASAAWELSQGLEEVAVQFATSSYLDVLGLTPHLGRWLEAEHDRVGAEMVAVVSHATWIKRMNADPSVIGSVIRLNNRPVTVIGVGPREFNGDANALVTDFWLSISSTPIGGPYRVTNLEMRGDHWYQVKARLAPGVDLAQARASIESLAARLAETYPDINAGRRIHVFAHDDVRFHPVLDGGLLGLGVGLVAVAAAVLLLTCSNLANLLLTRGLSRSAEIAVRESLGAERKRIASLLLFEALLLSAVGAALGAALAAWCASLLSSVSVPAAVGVSGSLDLGFDGRVAAFGALLAIVTGLMFGLLPALRTSKTDVVATLRDEGRGYSAGRGLSLLRKSLVVAQVAISVVLVIGTGLLARSLANAERVDYGVDAERIAVMSTNLGQAGVAEEDVPAVSAAILERVEALPGVERAALTTRLPVQGGNSTTQVIDGYTSPNGTGAVELPVAFVSRAYFETMGIALLAGRTFDATDRLDGAGVVLVNEAAARAFWRGEAVGGRVRQQSADSPWLNVVGVVGDVKVTDPTEPPTPMMYLPLEQFAWSAFSVVARTSGAPADITPALRTALLDVGASLPVTRLVTLEEHLGGALAAPRVGTALLGGFSLLALLLATLGIHALVAFSVERRMQELGIRAALGATRAGIVRLVVGDTLAAVALGLAAGLGLAAVAMRGLESALFGVPPVDGPTFLGAAMLLLAGACLAALTPALRAGRMNPVEVLKRS